MSVLGVADTAFWVKTLVVGAVSGVLSGMFGIGGGMITTPAIRLLLGGSAIAAVATPLPIIIPTAITGAVGYVRRGMADLRSGLIVGSSGALAAVVGAYATRWIGGSALMIATGVLVVYMAGDMLLAGRRAGPRAHAPEGSVSASEEGPLLVFDEAASAEDPATACADRGPAQDEWSLGPAHPCGERQAAACVALDSQAPTDDSQAPACVAWGSQAVACSTKKGSDRAEVRTAVIAPAPATAPTPATAPAPASAEEPPYASRLAMLGLGAGLYSGLLGLGGGFVIVPLLIRLFGFGTKRAIGTSLVAIAILSVPGTITHALLGHIDWRLAIALSLTVIPGAWLGARVTAAASERHVRAAFAVMLAVVGVVMFANEAWVLVR